MKKLILLAMLGWPCMAGAQHMVDRYLSGTPTYPVVANSANLVNQPRDLDFKPYTNELWVVNRGNSGGSPVVILYNAGEPDQLADYRKDSHAGHFMIYATAIAYGDDWEFATTNEIQNTATPTSTFMGPALWSSDTSIFARVFQSNWVVGKPLGSHLDMLHQSPFAMGIAHDSGSRYWVFDGHNGNLCKYDFGEDHSPGYDDHSNGKVWRYTDVPLTRTANIPGHMIKDKATGWLYIVDAGTRTLKRVNTNTGTIAGTLNVPATGAEPLLGYWEVTGAVVEVLDTFLSSQPCGIDLYDGRLVVGDYNNGNIYVYDITGATPVELGTIATGQSGMTGLKIGPDGKIWFVNSTQNTVIRIEPATLPANDAAITKITAPRVNNFGTSFYHAAFNQCASSVTPAVELKNAGTATLTAATIQFRIDNGSVSTYNWTGSLAAGAATSVSLPAISTPTGAHELHVEVLDPNGVPDMNPANNAKRGSFRTIDPQVGYPFSEDFAATSFPPAGWALIGYNFHNEMTHVATTGNLGNGSVRMDNFSSFEDVEGQKDYLITPRINFTSATGDATLRFAVAYAQYNASTNDGLKVNVSTDCGNTWTTVYNKAGAALATAAPSTIAFVPASGAEWRNEAVSLAAYAGQSDVIIQFMTTSDHGNNLYLDDISITNTAGVGETAAQGHYAVYPNPARDQVTIESRVGSQGMNIALYDMTGRLVKRSVVAGGVEKATLPVADLPNGQYVLRIDAEDGSSAQEKISIVR